MDELNDIKPASQAEEAEVELHYFTCHPIQSFKVGPWVFKGSRLTVQATEYAKFMKLLDSLPMQERLRIKPIDRTLAVKVEEAGSVTVTQGLAASDSAPKSVGPRVNLKNLGMKG